MKYILLGIIQGFTEFLPVSSSGHLAVFQRFFEVPHSMAFYVVVHLATALAAALYFWRDIIELFTTRRKMLLFILVAGIPTGLMGIAFKGFFEDLYGGSISIVGGFLLLSGLVIVLAEWMGKGRRGFSEMNIWDALIIGVAQGCAIAPGLSRSGTTVSASLARNLNRDLAARFSFLLAIPTIIGAELVEFRNVIDAGSHGVGFVPLLLGFLGAFISGWIAIKIFMEIIHRTSIRGFAYYCFAAGSLVLFFSILR